MKQYQKGIAQLAVVGYMKENNLNVLIEYYNKLTCIGLR